MNKKNFTSLQLIEGLDNPDLFTVGEWEIVQYIKKNMEYVIKMNIAELAQETYSSNSTIIRICRKLGCDGFKDLKIKLVQNIENSKYAEKDIDFSIPFHTGESVPDIISDMSSLYRNTLNAVQESIDPVLLKRMTDIISNSERLVIYGIGDSQITATGFVNKLTKIGVFALVATAYNEQTFFSKNLTSKDCTLFISYSGESRLLNDSLQILKKNRVPVLAITAGKESQLAKMSNEMIYIPKLEGNTDQKIATFYSQLSFGYILDIIFALLYNEKNDNQKKSGVLFH